MADIKPFKAYRPNTEKVSKIAALPYDVYNSAEARAIVEKIPIHSFLLTGLRPFLKQGTICMRQKYIRRHQMSYGQG